MSLPDLILTRLVEEPRDRTVCAILEAVARAIDSGAEIVPEPERRDAAGKVLRTGLLRLPRRSDLAVTRSGRTLFRRIEGGSVPGGDAVVVRTADGFSAEIEPFRWDAAALTVYSAQARPNWAPIRRWFLEWFQTRLTDVAPDLCGAVHSLEGPRPVQGGWSFTIDFGSAPPGCITDLVHALAETGAARMRLGLG